MPRAVPPKCGRCEKESARATERAAGDAGAGAAAALAGDVKASAPSDGTSAAAHRGFEPYGGARDGGCDQSTGDGRIFESVSIVGLCANDAGNAGKWSTPLASNGLASAQPGGCGVSVRPLAVPRGSMPARRASAASESAAMAQFSAGQREILPQKSRQEQLRAPRRSAIDRLEFARSPSEGRVP